MEHFNAPQRQSVVGVIVMFFDTVQQYARALWPLLVVWIFRFDSVDKVALVMTLCMAVAGIGVIAWLKYRNFTFFLDEDNQEFVITEGIVNKTRTTIALYKIQQVNIRQSLLQRMIGVYALDVDTAGSNEREVSIKAVSHPVALALKARLLDNDRSMPAQQPGSEIAERPFLRISLASLLKIGVTSNYVRTLGLLLAFFFTLYDNVLQFANRGYIDEDRVSGYLDSAVVMQSIGMFFAWLMAAILVINVVRTVVRYYGYTVARQQGSLLLSFGLFSTKSTIIKPEKVQIVSVTRNYFQKKLDILELRIRQATAGGREERKQAVEIPGCNSAERDAILQLLLGKIPTQGLVLRPNFRKLIFAIVLTIVLPLGLFLTVVTLSDDTFAPYLWIAPVYALFAMTLICFGYRNYRLFIADDFIIKQSGAWDVRREIIEPQKIQAIAVSQLFWHKAADIGYLTLHTAGGKISFELGDFTIIKQYVNRWLYEIETSDSNWM